MLTAFGDAQYYGPWGENDYRNKDARGARTVDYDVTRNNAEPVNVEPVNAEPVNAGPAGDDFAGAAGYGTKREEPETVDFFFDQPEE